MKKKYYTFYEERFKKLYESGAKFYYDPIHNKELEEFMNYFGFSKNMKIIEFGCGEGRNAVFLAKLGFDVTAVDLSYSAIKRAEEFAKENKVTVNFIIGDVLDLEFIKDETYDIVINNECIHMFIEDKDWNECLDEMYRVLRKDGYLYYFNLGYEQVLPEVATSQEFRAGVMRAHKVKVGCETKIIEIPCLPCKWVSKYELIEKCNEIGLSIEYIAFEEETKHIVFYARKC